MPNTNHSPSSSQIIERDPADLRVHPLHKNVWPKLAVDCDVWRAFVLNLDAAGPDGIPPVIITAKGEIMDGVRRWTAAKQVGWQNIRCEVREDALAGALMWESLKGQKDLTLGAKVYFFLGFNAAYIHSANTRRLANLSGKHRTLETERNPLIFSNSGEPSSESATAIIERIGCRWDTWSVALNLRRVLCDPKCSDLRRLVADTDRAGMSTNDLLVLQQELREEFEPKILSGEIGVERVASAIGGRLSTEEKTHQPEFDFASKLTPLANIVTKADGRHQLTDYIATAADGEVKKLQRLAETITAAIEKRRQS